MKARFSWVGGENIEKKYGFVDEFNELEIRTTKRCICKVCDKQLENEKIIYIKSFRLHAQPFIYVFLVGNRLTD